MDRLSKYILGLFAITILDFITINPVFLGLCIDVELLSKMHFILKEASLQKLLFDCELSIIDAR